MEQYIKKSALVVEIKKLRQQANDLYGCSQFDTAYNNVLKSIDTLEVKEVNEVPANVMLNQFGNKYISSWSGLKEYDKFQVNEEIKILIPDK